MFLKCIDFLKHFTLPSENVLCLKKNINGGTLRCLQTKKGMPVKCLIDSNFPNIITYIAKITIAIIDDKLIK